MLLGRKKKKKDKKPKKKGRKFSFLPLAGTHKCFDRMKPGGLGCLTVTKNGGGKNNKKWVLLEASYHESEGHLKILLPLIDVIIFTD